jgi:hypothetical protein
MGYYGIVNNKRRKIMKKIFLGNALGVAFSTHDDGCYSVYGYMNDDNRIMKVEIIMGDE